MFNNKSSKTFDNNNFTTVKSKKRSKYNKSNKSNKYNKYENGKKSRKNINYTTVRITDLPNDITALELKKNIKPWGDIDNWINIKKFKYDASAFIKFVEKDDATYFVKNLDRTYYGFDKTLIHVDII
jgi:hypothetical protein